jgi:acylphosphatase
VRIVRIAVQGRVQGVGFRDWIVRKARALELDGWVRNRSNNSVEILASGEAAAIERLVQAAHRGPPFAHVTEVSVEEGEAEAASGFARRPTL